MIKQSKGLAYVATNNSSQSKWCPWELGFFDGISNARCAILPILEQEYSSFNGQEYLGLYHHIEYERISGSYSYEFWVFENNSKKYIILRDWLKGSNPIEH